jgi:hypothetical protein
MTNTKGKETPERGWATRNMCSIWITFGLFMLLLFILENLMLVLDRVNP